MPLKYAQIVLYVGHCNADGVGEADFTYGRASGCSARGSDEAVQVVQKYLSEGYRSWSIQVCGERAIVHSEDEALRLIHFAETNVHGAQGVVNLLHSRHGRIFFERAIRFERGSCIAPKVLGMLSAKRRGGKQVIVDARRARIRP